MFTLTLQMCLLLALFTSGAHCGRAPKDDESGATEERSSSTPPLPQALPLTSYTTNLNNKTIVQAYPAITALRGSQVAIPCNISHQNARHTSPISPPLNGTFAHTSSGAASDGAHLILWYRGDDISGSPLYTVDGRDIGPKSASSQRNDDPTTGSSLRHFVGPELTGRARVNLASRPAMLLIDAIDAADSGTYWCRVDYRWTRTLISMVQLHVHVAPSTVNIWAVANEPKAMEKVPPSPSAANWSPSSSASSLNSNYLQSFFMSPNMTSSSSSSSSSSSLSIAKWSSSSSSSQTAANSAPNLLINVNEGANLLLFCESYGGNPPPSVIWFDSSNRILDATYDILNVSSLEEVKAYYEKVIVIGESPLAKEALRREEWASQLWTTWSSAGIVNQLNDTRKSGILGATSGDTPSLSVSINSMNLYRLDRLSAGATLTCLVNNSDLASSIRRSVQIDLNLNPSHVTIMPPTGSYLSDGLKTEVNCRAFGGKPYVLISWLLNGQNITHWSDYDFEVNYTTSSVLKFTPNWRQDDGLLHCVAYNPSIVREGNVGQSVAQLLQSSSWQSLSAIHSNQGQSLTNLKSALFASDFLILDIKYVPQIKLIQRESLQTTAAFLPESYFAPNFTEFTALLESTGDSHRLAYIHVEEGGNVTLDCIIIAKPKVTVVRWMHNTAEIWHETEGIVAENQSLSIINAKRGHHDGIFRCIAFNSEGRGASNEIRIAIDYAPQCTSPSSSSSKRDSIDSASSRGGSQSIYYAKIGETVNITCQLDARPAHNGTFYWTLNNQISGRLYIHSASTREMAASGSGDANDQVSSGNEQWASEQINWAHQRASKSAAGAGQFALLQSVASIVPRSAADFGIVRCWARNPIGYQATPCMFFLNQLPANSADTGQQGEPLDTLRSASASFPPRNGTLSGSANLPGSSGSSETLLIGTSSSAGSPQSLSPSSYSSMLSRTTSTGSSPSDKGHANSQSKQTRLKEPPLDSSSSSSSSQSSSPFPSNQQQPSLLHYSLRNHFCQLNRTLSSIALNCSLIDSSSLSSEIAFLSEEGSLRLSPIASSSSPSPSIVSPFVIVTYLVELYDNADNLLSGHFIGGAAAADAELEISPSPVLAQFAGQLATSGEHPYTLLYTAVNLTSGTTYKLKLKTFLLHQRRRKRKRSMRRVEKISGMKPYDAGKQLTSLDFDLTTRGTILESLLRPDVAHQSSQRSSVPFGKANWTVASAIDAISVSGRPTNVRNGQRTADNGNYMAGEQMMEPSREPANQQWPSSVHQGEHASQMGPNGAHSARRQQSDHSSQFGAPSNGTFLNLRIDPLQKQTTARLHLPTSSVSRLSSTFTSSSSLSSSSGSNPGESRNSNDSIGQRLDERRSRRNAVAKAATAADASDNYGSDWVKKKKKTDKEDKEDDYEDDYGNGEEDAERKDATVPALTTRADSDAKTAEMQPFTPKTAEHWPTQSLRGQFPGAIELQMAGHLGAATRVVDTIGGVMNRRELRTYRSRLRQMQKDNWQRFGEEESIHFQTLSRDATSVGFTNQAGNLPNSDIVPKSLTDQALFRPGILLSIGCWILLVTLIMVILGFVCYRVRAARKSRSSSGQSSDSQTTGKRELPASHRNSCSSIRPFEDSQASGNHLTENMTTLAYGRHNLEQESSILYETHNGGPNRSDGKLQLFTDHEQGKLVSQNYTKSGTMNVALVAAAEESMMPLDLIAHSTITSASGAGFTILQSGGPTFLQSPSPSHQAMFQQLLLEQSAAMAARAHNNSSNNSSYSTITTSSSILGGGGGGSSSSGATNGANNSSAGKLLRYSTHEPASQLTDIVELTGNNALEEQFAAVSAANALSATNCSDQLMLNLMRPTDGTTTAEANSMATALQQFNSPGIQVYEQGNAPSLLINQADGSITTLDGKSALDFETMLLMNQTHFGADDTLANLHVKLCDPQMETNIDESNGNFAFFNFDNQQGVQPQTATSNSNSQQQEEENEMKDQVITSYSTRV